MTTDQTLPQTTFDISHSDLASYLQCRRQFWFSYCLGFSDNRFPVGAAPAGTRVHEALEALYPHFSQPPGDPAAQFEQLAAADVEQATLTNQPPWVFDKLYDDILLGRRMVADYLTWIAETNHDAEWVPICTEAKLRYLIALDDPVWLNLDDPAIVAERRERLASRGFTAIRLQGKVDLIQQHASTYLPPAEGPSQARFAQLRATDWKTTGRTFQVDEGFQRSNQSYFYDMLLELAQEIPPELQEARLLAQAHSAPPPELNYRIIQRPRSRNAPTEVRDLPVTHSTFMRRSRRRQIFSMITDMIDMTLDLDDAYPATGTTVHSAERLAYPSPSDACGWCSYKPPCDITDDGPDLAVAMLSTSEDYVGGQRHARYAETPVEIAAS